MWKYEVSNPLLGDKEGARMINDFQIIKSFHLLHQGLKNVLHLIAKLDERLHALESQNKETIH